MVTLHGTVHTTTITTSSSTTYISAPTATVIRKTPYYYKWATVKFGHDCYSIETEYGITLDDFIVLNTFTDSACDNLWPDYAYCVSGLPTAMPPAVPPVLPLLQRLQLHHTVHRRRPLRVHRPS
jgi:hypothetical protein